MARRFVKQLFYGILYGAALAALAYGVFRASAPKATCTDNIQNQDEEEIDCGGPCGTCAVRHLSSLEAAGISVVSVRDTAAALIRVRNPNPAYGARDFVYELVFSDEGNREIARVAEHSFIYAGEQKEFVAIIPSLDARRIRGTPEISFQDPLWRAAEEFPRPAHQLRDQHTEALSTGENVASGIFVNTNSFLLPLVEIGAALYDASGALQSLSETVIRDIKPFEERFFKVIVPLPPGAQPVVKTEFVVEIYPSQ